MVGYLKSLKSFPNFKAASIYARTEAIKLATLHTIRRGDGGKFEVCARYGHVLYKFQKLAIDCGIVKQGDDMGCLKQACLETGLSAAGWRFMNRHGDTTFKAAIQSSLDCQTNLMNILTYVEWQQQAGLKYPLPQSMGECYVMTVGMILDSDFKIDPRIAVAGVKRWFEFENDEQRSSFLHTEWVKVLVWLRDEKPSFDRNQWHAGWGAVWRRYLTQVKLNANYYKWVSPLNHFSIDRLNVIPLTDSYKVALEGLQMRHCVSTYSELCFLGEYRLFSITLKANNKAIATVGLSFGTGVWRLDQVKQKCNKEPTDLLIKIGKAISKLYQAAYVREVITPSKILVTNH